MGGDSNVTKKPRGATDAEHDAALRRLRRQGKKKTKDAKKDYNSKKKREA